MRNVISLENLTKTYRKTEVVSHITLNIPEGAVYGFIGPNGAGKSTTMKMILGLVEPTEGNIRLFDEPLTFKNRGAFVSRIGEMIEEPAGYGHLTAEENLEIVRKLLEFPKKNIDWALDIVGLSFAKKKKVREFSLGMKQRLGIALAICRKPALLILDEPTNGLDPYGIEEIRILLSRLATQEGATVMVSSHILAELEKVSTHFGILNHGKLIFEGERSELVEKHSPALFIIRTNNPEKALSICGVGAQVSGGIEIPQISDSQISDVCRRLLAADIEIYEVSRPYRSLENIFMELTKEKS